MSTLWWIVLALVVQTASLADEAPATRPFRLGFTLWPADISLDGIRIAQEFAFAHGDVISAHFDGGP